MKRQIYLALSLLTIALTATAQRVEIRELFKSIPTTIVPLLTEENKEALLQSYDAKSRGELSVREVRNLLGGATAITEMTPDYIALQLDEDSQLQIKVLPLFWRGYVVSVVATSTIAPQQSVMNFYDKKWQPLSSDKYFQQPALDSFLTQPSLLTLNKVKQVLGEIGPLVYRYEWSPTELRLTTYITTFDTALYKGLYPEALQWVKQKGVDYQWKRGRLQKL